MYEVNSFARCSTLKGLVLYVPCPVNTERTVKALHADIGPVLVIDGVPRQPLTYEFIWLPKSLIKGEWLGVVVKQEI